MKKMFLLILIVIMLSACSSNDNQISENFYNNNDKHAINENTVTEPEDDISIRYDSVDDLVNSLSDANNGQITYSLGDMSDKVYLSNDEVLDTLNEFKTERESENNIVVPFYNNQVIALRDEEGYSNIILMSNTVYNQPAVMYYTTHNDCTISTYITYVDSLVSEEIISQADEKGTLWLYEQIEDIVTIPNLVADYKEHYEKEIQLSNSTKKAVVIEFNNTTTDRVFVSFAYDNVMVNAFGNRDALEDWLKGADFKEISLD